MPGQVDELSRQLGRIEAQIITLFKRIDVLEEASTREHRIVHDIVEATSDAVRTLTHKVDEMKPLTDDYREKRAEARGAARLVHLVYAIAGGSVAVAAGKIIEMFGGKTPPHP